MRNRPTRSPIRRYLLVLPLIGPLTGGVAFSAAWEIPLMVTDGERIDQLVTGVAAEATDGYDARYDFPHAPAPPSPYLVAYFHHPEWGVAQPPWYREDIRKEKDLLAAGAKPEMWVANSNLIVSSSLLNRDLTISWNVREVPAGYRVLLHDPTAGLTIDCRQQGSYTFNNGQSSSRGFELRVSGSVEFRFRLGAGLQLAAMPGSTGGVEAQTFFGTSRVARRNTAAAAWVKYADSPFKLDPGRGYAVVLGGDTELAVTSVASSPSAVPLAGAGWHVVGNPFAEPLVWDLDAIKFTVNGGASQPMRALVNSTSRPVEFYGWTRSGADAHYQLLGDLSLLPGAHDTLAVGAGAWLRTRQDGVALVLDQGTGRGSATAKRSAERDGHWAMRLTAESGGLAASPVWLGESSRFGPNGITVACPPPLGNAGVFVSVALTPTGETGRAPTAVELRTPRARQTWHFAVTTNLLGEEVRLAWPDLSTMPSRYRLRLIDLATGQSRSMRSVASYAFRSEVHGFTNREFRVELCPAQDGVLRFTNVGIVPAGRARGGFTVSYVLSAKADVQLRVRNAAGRVVAVSPPHPSRGGTNLLAWDGRTTEGRIPPRGLCLFELTARRADGQAARAVRAVPIR